MYIQHLVIFFIDCCAVFSGTLDGNVESKDKKNKVLFELKTKQVHTLLVVYIFLVVHALLGVHTRVLFIV